MFQARRVLEKISERLAGMDERSCRALGEISETLSRMDRRSDETLAAIHDLQDVNREILLELRSHRAVLDRIDNGVQANARGLTHVLDELRGGRGGPGAAPAA